jgi:hypothetical protein
VSQHGDTLIHDRWFVLGEQLEALTPLGNPGHRFVVAVALGVVIVPLGVLVRVTVPSIVAFFATPEKQPQHQAYEDKAKPTSVHSNSPLAARNAITARFAARANSSSRSCTALRVR